MGLKDRITLLLLFKMLLSCAQLGTVDDRGSFLAAGDDCGKDGPLGPEVYCATQDSISINDIQQFTVVVPPDAGYNLVIQLASLVGDADLCVMGVLVRKACARRTWGGVVAWMGCHRCKPCRPCTPPCTQPSTLTSATTC